MRNLKDIMEHYGITGVMLSDASLKLEIKSCNAGLGEPHICRLKNGCSYTSNTLAKVVRALQSLVPAGVTITEDKLISSKFNINKKRNEAKKLPVETVQHS